MREVEQSGLPDFCRKPTLVLGCGNILFGDDGFGCAVVDYLEKHHDVPEAVCLLDAGTSVRKLLFTLCLSPVRPDRVLILDAIDAGRSPGEVFEINPADIPTVKLDDFSLHQLPTSNLLRELQESCGVEVRVLACQTGPLPEEISPGLSSPIQAALPRAAEWLMNEYLPRKSTMCVEEARSRLRGHLPTGLAVRRESLAPENLDDGSRAGARRCENVSRLLPSDSQEGLNN